MPSPSGPASIITLTPPLVSAGGSPQPADGGSAVVVSSDPSIEVLSTEPVVPVLVSFENVPELDGGELGEPDEPDEPASVSPEGIGSTPPQAHRTGASSHRDPAPWSRNRMDMGLSIPRLLGTV